MTYARVKVLKINKNDDFGYFLWENSDRFASKRVFCKYENLSSFFHFVNESTIKSNSHTINILTGAVQGIFTDISDISQKRKMLWNFITKAGYRTNLQGLKTNTIGSIAVFACSIRKAIIVWSIADGKEFGAFPIDHIKSDYQIYVVFDDRYIIYTNILETKIINIENLKVIFSYDKELANLKFNCNSHRIFWLEEGHIYVFNVQTEQYEGRYDFIQNSLKSFKISKDSGLISGSTDKGIVVYNYLTQEYITNVSTNGNIWSYDIFGFHLCITYKKDCQYFITVYDIVNGDFIYQRKHEEQIGYFALSPNISYIAYELYKKRQFVVVENLRDDTFSLYAETARKEGKVEPIIDFLAVQNEIFALYPDKTRYINLINEEQNVSSFYIPRTSPMWKIGTSEDAIYCYSNDYFILNSITNPQRIEICTYKGLPFTVSPNGKSVAYSRRLNLTVKSIRGSAYSVSFKDIPELISLDYEYGNNNLIFINNSQLLVIHELGLSLWEINCESDSFVKLSKSVRFVDDKLPFPIIGKFELILNRKHKHLVIKQYEGCFRIISLSDLSLSKEIYDKSEFCTILNIELSPDEDYILCCGYKEYKEQNDLGTNYIMDTLLMLRADTFECVDFYHFEKGFTVAHFAENHKILVASRDGNIYSVEFPNLQD